MSYITTYMVVEGVIRVIPTHQQDALLCADRQSPESLSIFEPADLGRDFTFCTNLYAYNLTWIYADY